MRIEYLKLKSEKELQQSKPINMQPNKYTPVGYIAGEGWKQGKKPFSEWLEMIELIRISKLPNTGIGFYTLKAKRNESKNDIN